MPREFLLLSEAAETARVSLSTIRHWVATGQLKSSRPGRRRLIRRTDFDAFLTQDIAARGPLTECTGANNGGRTC